MIVVSAKDLTKAYGTDVILDKVSFHINKGDRVGIIGINGAGKTTLLKMLTGELPCESGEFFISSETKTGYLKQDRSSKDIRPFSQNGKGNGSASDAYRKKSGR